MQMNITFELNFNKKFETNTFENKKDCEQPVFDANNMANDTEKDTINSKSK